MNFHLATLGCVCCVPTLGLSLLAMKLKVDRLNKKVAVIIGKYGGERFRLEFRQMAKPTAQVPDHMGIDQYGRRLERPLGEDGDMGVEPVWPPLGYNVVATVPGKISWPPLAPEVMK
eukprot:EG_transcript_20337